MSRTVNQESQVNTNRISAMLGAAVLLTCCAHPAHHEKPQPIAPQRVFSCQGFTKHADGSWWAGPNTLPFNVGSNADVVIRNAGPITRHFAVFETGENLYDVIEGHCGAAAKR